MHIFLHKNIIESIKVYLPTTYILVNFEKVISYVLIFINILNELFKL